MDGTLADTSEGIFNSIRYVQEKLDLPQISDEQMRFHIGPPIQESYSKNFNLNDLELEKAVQYHKEYAVCQGLYEASLYPGMTDLLELLNKKGYKQAVATLKFEETAKKMLRHLDIFYYFEIICGASSNSHLSKAQLLEKCINAMNCKKSETLLIGDSAYDAIGASEIGIDFLAVTYGFGFSDKKDVESYPHIGYVESVRDIVQFLNNVGMK